MAVLMAEDKSRYNEINTILYEMGASKAYSSIVESIITLNHRQQLQNTY